MPYGLEDGDMGTIVSISWSMYNGYFPHLDFVYIKPPFSPYFHSWPFYISETYGYLINRTMYYLQIFLYSLWAIKILCREFNIERRDTVYFLALLGALISIHDYPPMPWNTVDGVFFTILGAWFLLKPKHKWFHIALGAFFVSLAVLCKQSFFFVPVLLVVYFLLKKDFRQSIYFILYGLFFAMLYVGIIYINGAFDAMWEQLFSFTTSSSFKRTGFLSYIDSLRLYPWIVLGYLAIVFTVRYFANKNTVFAVVLAGPAICFLYIYLTEENYGLLKQVLIQAMWMLATGFTFLKSLQNKQYRMLLLFLGFGWCASISNGFNTPVDFSAPILFAFFVFSYSETYTLKKSVGLASIAVFLALFYLGYQTPYLDSPRKELTYNMGEVFPQLKGIKSDAETFNKYKELKHLASKYDNFTILPSVTLGHYLTNTKNPIGVDWVFNHHLADQIPEYINKLEDKDVTVFLENFENHANNYEETSTLTMYVKENWQLVATYDYFRIYQKQR
ncbi:glycosyltransferase family 87 protein [Marinirhabdus gelatinilytica]|nr:glycosyltransferase family 87 protein [Marinirhabdus gelatinilytica]